MGVPGLLYVRSFDHGSRSVACLPHVSSAWAARYSSTKTVQRNALGFKSSLSQKYALLQQSRARAAVSEPLHGHK